MPVTNYDTVDGEIIGETTGGAYTDYGVDALGSVVATIDSSSAVVNTYRFKPYGSTLAKTGVGGDPRFDWVGARGYRATARKYGSTYARARHYASPLSGWTTVDRRWPYDRAYVYVNGRPVSLIDPSGLHPCEARTAAYCSWYRDFGFWGSSCFCYVSGKMCEFLKLPVEYICEQIHEWAAEGLNPILDLIAGQLCDAQVAAIKAWVDCMNRDLFDCAWRKPGACSPGGGKNCWRDWYAGLPRPGFNSCGKLLFNQWGNLPIMDDCCHSQVRCEQKEYTAANSLTGPCGPIDHLAFPLEGVNISSIFAVLAPIFNFPPFPFDGTQQDRIRAAHQMCCVEKVWRHK